MAFVSFVAYPSLAFSAASAPYCTGLSVNERHAAVASIAAGRRRVRGARTGELGRVRNEPVPLTSCRARRRTASPRS